MSHAQSAAVPIPDDSADAIWRRSARAYVGAGKGSRTSTQSVRCLREVLTASELLSDGQLVESRSGLRV